MSGHALITFSKMGVARSGPL